MNDCLNILKQKNFIISQILVKESIKNNLSLNEFLLLVYFMNTPDQTFNLENIKLTFKLNEKSILDAFNSLTVKNLIKLESFTDDTGKINEIISLDEIYKQALNDLNNNDKKKNKQNIFEIFEKEFERTLSPIEYEIINAWLDNNISEELIYGALKEAIFNGVKSFRYIDKIIYEWNKKGFKTMEDVNKHLQNKYEEKKKNEKEELFDYDWLDESEI